MFKKIIGILVLFALVWTGIYINLNKKDQSKNADASGSSQPKSQTTVSIGDMIKQKEKETTNGKKYGEQIIDLDKVSTFLNKYITHLNTGDYQSAYSMLEIGYTDDFGITLDAFKAKNSFKSNKALNIVNFKDLGDRYIVNAILVDDVSSDNESPGDQAKPIIFTVYKDGTGYRLDDKGISNTYKSIKSLDFINPHVKMVISKVIYMHEGGILCKLEFTNQEDSSIEIGQASDSIIGQGEKDYHGEIYNALPDDYTVKDGETKKISIFIPYIKNLKSLVITLKDGRSLTIK